VCASEVSDIEASVWQRWRDEGLVVWGVGGLRDDAESLATFADQLGLTYPVLFDADGAVYDAYTQQTAFTQTIYPQEWIIGADGRVAYVSNGYAHDEVAAVIEAELKGRD